MLQKRSAETELMDDLLCAGPVVSQTLRELDFINTWLGGNDVTLGAVEACIRKLEKQDLLNRPRIADLGCGGGEMLKLIARKTRKKNLEATFVGVDANPFIIEYARENTKGFKEISFLQSDVLSESFRRETFDIVNCTLFCHHFDNETLAQFLKNLAQQTLHYIVINDIHRHWFAYHSIKWLTRFFSSSPMVKNDAKLSVLRAFLRSELEEILKKAGLPHYTIRWKWAFRYEIIIHTHAHFRQPR